MPEDKRNRGSRKGKDAYIAKAPSVAKTKGREGRTRITLGDRRFVELSPYDPSRGSVIYKLPAPADKTPGVTIIEFSHEEHITDDTFEGLNAAINECVMAVSQAHEQIEKNRPEIESLGRETRQLLSELKAA